MGRSRILITPREIAGIAAGLQDGLTGLGHDVDVMLRWRHPFEYRFTEPRALLARCAARVMIESEDSRFRKINHAVSLAVRFALLPLIAMRYDAVVYIGPDTLLRNGLDRRWLSRRGVRTVTVFCGSEARPPYMDGWFGGLGAERDQLERARAEVIINHKRVQAAERESTYVVNHPGTAQFHEQRFVDWTILGFPTTPGPLPTRRAHAPRPSLRVLHAPSVPRMKGTEEIRAAVAALAVEGVTLDYVEITGRPHADVMELLGTADLVVDQLYSDALLPGLATEAARSGVPVLVFGHAETLLHEIAERAVAPTIHYHRPSRLLDELRRVVTDDDYRMQIQTSLEAFVQGWWSPDRVAARWSLLLEGKPDDAWFDDPADFAYVGGCAISKQDLTTFLRAYVERFGSEGLALGHAPATEAAILDVARNGMPEA